MKIHLTAMEDYHTNVCGTCIKQQKMSKRIFCALGASSQMMRLLLLCNVDAYVHLFARPIWIFFPHCKLKIVFYVV